MAALQTIILIFGIAAICLIYQNPIKQVSEK
jgi:hypothetical protein